MKRIGFALLIILSASVAGAANYYVDDSGSDSNPGTLASPFRTITKGVSMISAAGDTVTVRAGTYNESVLVWNKQGTSTAPIYITAYTNETPIIDGTGTTQNAVVAISDSSYVRFDGFEIRNGPHSGVLVWESSYVKVRWNNVHDCQEFGIHTSADLPGGTHHIVIEGNDVKHNVLSNSDRNEASGWVQGIGAFYTDDIEITGNYVRENYGEGIDIVVGNRGTIRQNQVWDNFSCNIYLDNAKDTVVDRNFVVTGWAATPSNYYRDSSPGHGIAAANEDYDYDNPLDGITITNNIVAWCKTGFMYGNWGNGGGLHDTLIANNTFYHSTAALLWIETDTHDTTVVSNNIFSASSGVDYAWSPTSGFTFRTNCCYGGNSGTHITGSGDVMSNPLMVNPSGGTPNDYKLSSTSPCKTAGTTESAVTTDYWGTTRTSSYSIGAHEY